MVPVRQYTIARAVVLLAASSFWLCPNRRESSLLTLTGIDYVAALQTPQVGNGNRDEKRCGASSTITAEAVQQQLLVCIPSYYVSLFNRLSARALAFSLFSCTVHGHRRHSARAASACNPVRVRVPGWFHTILTLSTMASDLVLAVRRWVLQSLCWHNVYALSVFAASHVHSWLQEIA